LKGLIETTSFPENLPKGWLGIEVTYIGTFLFYFICLTSRPASIREASKVKLHPRRNETRGEFLFSCSYLSVIYFIFNTSSVHTPFLNTLYFGMSLLRSEPGALFYGS
jgi:hypothetical protein